MKSFYAELRVSNFCGYGVCPLRKQFSPFSPRPPPIRFEFAEKSADKYSIAGKLVNLRFFQEFFFEESKDPLSINKFLTLLYLHKSVSIPSELESCFYLSK